jgi:hypothetical protein
MKNHKHKGLRIYKQRDRTQKETQDHLDLEGEARAPMPALDKPMDQLLTPSLKRENMTAYILSKKQLDIEDKMPHN